MLLAGAYNAEAVQYGYPQLAGIKESYADGSFDALDTFAESAPLGSAPSSESAAAAQIDQNLVSANLTPVSVTFEHPDLLAPVVVASTSNPTTYMANRASIDIFGDAAYEGELLEVEDSQTGAVFFVWGDSPRTQGVVSWTAPQYQTDDGGFYQGG
jgi:hypothetical protein